MTYFVLLVSKKKLTIIHDGLMNIEDGIKILIGISPLHMNMQKLVWA